MKNLAGDKEADKTILEELYLANIPAIASDNGGAEVPYHFMGKIGKWTFKRNWYYWVASVGKDETGLPLDVALELHNKKHPTQSIKLGEIIRAGGDCSCPSPDSYVAKPIWDDELYSQLEKLGYEKKYHDKFKMYFVDITFGDVAKLCNEGKLNVKRFVNVYHIDEQIGLNEFVKAIKDSNCI